MSDDKHIFCCILNCLHFSKYDFPLFPVVFLVHWLNLILIIDFYAEFSTNVKYIMYVHSAINKIALIGNVQHNLPPWVDTFGNL